MPVPLDHRTVVHDSSPPPTADRPTSRPSKQLPMVGWYQPSQLIRTGIAVLISTIFGRHSDHRLVEALGTTALQIYDYTYDYHQDAQGRCEPDLSHPRQELWFDYVGDVGDGWHSTYAVAYALAQEKLHITKDTNGGHYDITTSRGALLIFGGDEVYPTASQEAYEQRLIGPYATALRKTEASASPHIFAIPGNHDWYDSLASFIRLFTSRRWFGGWRTRQTRSYFALRLPQKWWILGTDVQLGSDIDRPQVQYFEHVSQEIEQLDPGARIILCHAEPHWVYKQMYQGMDPAYSESNLALLEKRLGKDVSVFIAGDQHHYRRYEAQDGTQKITSGGGGAFLHPTHTGRWGRDLCTITEEAAAEHGVQSGRAFRQVTCFPSEDVSRKLCWRTLIFPYLRGNASWSFGLVTGLFYWLSTLALLGNVARFPLQPSAHPLAPCPDCSVLAQVTGWTLDTLLGSPLTLFWVVLMAVGFVLLTDTHSRLYRGIAGPIHALFHIAAAFAVALGMITLVLAWTTPAWVRPLSIGGYVFALDGRLVLASLGIGVGGFVVGSFIMGLYLLVSLNLFGRHWNEAFSALAIPDWKHFLRLHIAENGDLTIYPIGIHRVPRRWEPGDAGPELVPHPSEPVDPVLLEAPITLHAPVAQMSKPTRAHSIFPST
jgi:hypothetical protein